MELKLFPILLIILASLPPGTVGLSAWGQDGINQNSPPSQKGIIGSTGNGPGEFHGPYSIAVDSSKNIFVADRGNNRIEKFSSNGTFITQFGSSCELPDGPGCKDPDGNGPMQKGDGQFYLPSGVAVDSADNLYVVDTGNHRIEYFSSNGSFISSFGMKGVGDGQFDSPLDLTVDPHGDIFVADSANRRIEKFDSQRDFISSWKIDSGGPTSITIDPSGNILVTIEDSSTGDNYIQEFSNDGKLKIRFGNAGGCKGEFASAKGMTSDDTGNIFLADQGNRRIDQFLANGTFVRIYSDSLSGKDISPSDVAVDSDRVLYIADQRNDRLVVTDFDSMTPTGGSQSQMQPFSTFFRLNSRSYTDLKGMAAGAEVVCGRITSPQSIELELQFLSNHTAGKIQLDFPKNIVKGIYSVTDVAGQKIEYKVLNENESTTRIEFELPSSADTVNILATEIAPEFPSAFLLLLSATVMVIILTRSRLRLQL